MLYSFMFLFILGNMVTSQQELVTLPTKTQWQWYKQHVHAYERTDLRMIQLDMNKNLGHFALKLSTGLRELALKYKEQEKDILVG